MTFALDQIFNYQTYLRNKGDVEGGLSEDMWNSMTPQERLANWPGGQLMLKPGDPGYDEIAGQTKGEAGRNIWITLDPQGTSKPGDAEGYLVDPTKEFKGDGFYAHSEDNQTPGFQHKDDDTWDYGTFAAVAAILATGGAAAFGAAGAGAGAGLGAEGVLGAAAGEGFGTAVGSTAGGYGIGGAVGAAPGAGGLSGLGQVAGDFVGPPGDLAAGNFVGPPGDLAAGYEISGPLDPISSGTVNPLTSGGPTFDGNFLQQLNQGRQYVSRGRTIANLLGGNGSSGGRNGMPSGPGSGGGGGFDLASFLGMLGLGHNALGRGLGTAEGAEALGDRAAGVADPWGSSGRRESFASTLTPDYVAHMLRSDPDAMKNDPGYRFMLEQGTNAINVGSAAQGSLNSGNRLYELQDFGQGLGTRYAQQVFQNNLGRLGVVGNLAGVNAGSPGAAAEALWQGGRNAANIRNGSMNGLFGSGGPGGSGNLLGLLGQGGSALWNWLSGNGALPEGFDLGTYLGSGGSEWGDVPYEDVGDYVGYGEDIDFGSFFG